MFCSDQMSGSHFIMQTGKFLLIHATAMTLGQGHGKIIQYISLDLYILYLAIYFNTIWTSLHI